MPMLQERSADQKASSDAEAVNRGPGSIRIRRQAASVPVIRKLSDVRIRTDLCEGPLPDSPRTPEQEISMNAVSDRAELIERLKRGESLTWIPNHRLESRLGHDGPLSRSRIPELDTKSPILFPAANITDERTDAWEERADSRLQHGISIERPRSALHSGVFTPDEVDSGNNLVEQELAREEDDKFRRSRLEHSPSITRSARPPAPSAFDEQTRPCRREALGIGFATLSSSFSSFVHKVPTSPLAQSQNNDEVGFTGPHSSSLDIASRKPAPLRRHSLNLSQCWPHTDTSLEGSHVSTVGDRNAPYQAHQSRRSLASTPNFEFLDGSPRTPGYLRSRRISYSSDVSPLQHASMVGSYEESILRGRMSTTPSKPLEFIAQIGVLGLGKCKSSLRYPQHVTLPFSAVFYSYAKVSNGRSRVEDGPSPYVGQIDLESGLLGFDDDRRSKRKMHSRLVEGVPGEGELSLGKEATADCSEADAPKPVKYKRRSRSPRAAHGGRYRIPEKGQLQIIIKNQNKTAVKLFLVPYDLAGMEPGTKTFVRQRSYSAGPILDDVPSLKETGTARVLRYLIHLQICCPSKDRFYLYNTIRVVFANRVPDGKEKLGNEVTYPEPRFSPYHPGHKLPSQQATNLGGLGGILVVDEAFGRQSSGSPFAHSPRPLGSQDSYTVFRPPILELSPRGYSHFGKFAGTVPVEPAPFRIPHKASESEASEVSDSTVALTVSPGSTQASSPHTFDPIGDLVWTGRDESPGTYGKLSKGDVGYGGNVFTSLLTGSRGVAAEGLLSRRLRSLGVQNQLSDGESKKMGMGE